MSNNSKISVSQIVESISNLLNYSSSIQDIITKIESNKKTIINKCECLEEYNHSKVPHTKNLTMTEEGYIEQYKIWIIKGQSEKINNIEGIDSVINDLNNLIEQLNNMIYDAINRAMEIEGFIDELNTILVSNSLDTITSKLIEKDLIQKNISFKEAENNGFTIQGITEIDGTYLVTAYKKGEKSKIYIYDQISGILKGEIILNNSAHVGGISYDKENDIIFVTGSKGTINAYNYNLIKFQLDTSNTKVLDFNNMDVNDIIINNNISIKESKANDFGTVSTKVGAAATVYYKDNQLYVGTFDGVNEGELVCYNLNYNKDENGLITSITAGFNNKSKIPKQTQGIAIANYNGKEYLITTQSISDTPSQITMYEKNGNELTYVGTDTNYSHGLEGITINGNNITMCYENNDIDVTYTSIEDLYKRCTSNSDIDTFQELNRTVKGLKYNKKHGID